MRSLLILLAGLLLIGTAEAHGTVTFELVSPPELTVEQGSAYSPTEIFPLQGEPLLVLGRLRNDGTEQVALTGPGGVTAPALNGNLWRTFPGDLWDPDADPDDALITNPFGVRALVLEPGESFEHPFLRVWGVDVTSDDPLHSAPIGTQMILHDVFMGFWDGLDRNPNDALDSPDVFPILYEGPSITVVPESPSVAFMLLLAASVCAERQTRHRYARR